MRSVQFTSKLYLGYVFVLLAYYLLNSSYMLIQSFSLIALLPWVIQMTVLILIMVRHKWVKYGIKGWSLFFILGSGLQLFGQLMYLLSDAQDKMASFGEIIRLLVTFLLGLILFAFADKSIKDIPNEVQSKSQTESE